MLIQVLGGARSGKSSVAEALAAASDAPVTVIATSDRLAPDGSVDAEMAARIARHVAERPAGWFTVEAPIELADALAGVPEEHTVIVDCLTVWLGNVLFAAGGSDEGPTLADPSGNVAAVAAAAAARGGRTIVVSNEVGGGIVPMDPLSRHYRDHHGWMNQAVARLADRVLLCVAGRVVELEPFDPNRFG